MCPSPTKLVQLTPFLTYCQIVMGHLFSRSSRSSNNNNSSLISRRGRGGRGQLPLIDTNTASTSNNPPTPLHPLSSHHLQGKSTPEHKSPGMGHFPIGDIHSIVPKDTLLVLWQWLPIRITMYQPVLLYTTEEHGCSLTTFFKRVEHHEPTILIIKTTKDEVFGAYCSTHWGARNEKDEKGDRQRYFGTGETFLFSLWPERKKYPWVGIKPRPVVENEDIENEDPHIMNNAKRKGRGEELFMHADIHMISVGGGEGQGICLDEDLRFGKSESCNTFQNPPLAALKDFEVSVLEVIGFSC